MITIYLRYVIDPYKVDQFEEYGKRWIPLVERYGGVHHGYFLPFEGANNIAIAIFTFLSLAEYETYRINSLNDEDCKIAYEQAHNTKCIVSYDRTFMKPVFN